MDTFPDLHAPRTPFCRLRGSFCPTAQTNPSPRVLRPHKRWLKLGIRATFLRVLNVFLGIFLPFSTLKRPQPAFPRPDPKPKYVPKGRCSDPPNVLTLGSPIPDAVR